LTVFRIAFVRKVKGAEKAVGFKSTAWLRICLIGLIGTPAAKEEVLKNSKLTNWEPNSLSGLSEDS